MGGKEIGWYQNQQLVEWEPIAAHFIDMDISPIQYRIIR